MLSRSWSRPEARNLRHVVSAPPRQASGSMPRRLGPSRPRHAASYCARQVVYNYWSKPANCLGNRWKHQRRQARPVWCDRIAPLKCLPRRIFTGKKPPRGRHYACKKSPPGEFIHGKKSPGRIYNSPPLLKIRPPYKKIAPPIKNSPLSQCTCFEVGDFYHVEILPR